MSPAHGRPPSKDPKRNDVRIRLTDTEREKLDFCAKKTRTTKAEIIRRGINLVYENEKKYEKSFQVDKDEIPETCPKCGEEFEFPGDVDISPYKDGYRDVLICPKCGFEMVVGYTTEEDVKEEMRKLMYSDL